MGHGHLTGRGVPSVFFPSRLQRLESSIVRIIAGKFRHRVLHGPPADTTRPITDRVKQSLFDALAVAVGFDDARVLDVFAGTGSMGLECLSRGAAEVVFIERDKHAIAALRNNIAMLGVEGLSRIISADVYQWREAVGKDRGRYKLIFFDPPYSQMREANSAAALDALMISMLQNYGTPDAVLLLRYPFGLNLASMKVFSLIRRQADYGSMSIVWISNEPV